ncbi:MAG: glycosyltransferase, partial [candidate division NC10 bacterium]|nr:glycosyltransferase [candidate division NC10 bacterium]
QARALGLADRIAFAGFREDIPSVLAGTDLVVLPSLNEGMGRVLVMAMVLGKPIVATRVGGVAELLGDGEAGVLVPARDPAALAEAISEPPDRAAWPEAVPPHALGGGGDPVTGPAQPGSSDGSGGRSRAAAGGGRPRALHLEQRRSEPGGADHPGARPGHRGHLPDGEPPAAIRIRAASAPQPPAVSRGVPLPAQPGARAVPGGGPRSERAPARGPADPRGRGDPPLLLDRRSLERQPDHVQRAEEHPGLRPVSPRRLPGPPGRREPRRVALEPGEPRVALARRPGGPGGVAAPAPPPASGSPPALPAQRGAAIHRLRDPLSGTRGGVAGQQLSLSPRPRLPV